jgi:hypothetical protein
MLCLFLFSLSLFRVFPICRVIGDLVGSSLHDALAWGLPLAWFNIVGNLGTILSKHPDASTSIIAESVRIILLVSEVYWILAMA